MAPVLDLDSRRVSLSSSKSDSNSTSSSLISHATPSSGSEEIVFVNGKIWSPDEWYSCDYISDSDIEAFDRESKEIEAKSGFFDKLETPTQGVMKSYVSMINELEQHGYIKDVQFSPGTQTGFQWYVDLTAKHFTGPGFVGSGKASTKKEAKNNCARDAYFTIRDACIVLPSPDPSDKVPTARPPTTKQLRVLDDAAQHRDLLRELATETDVTFVSIDVEVNEVDHSMILEVGMTGSKVTKADVQPHISSMHFIVEDFVEVRNSKFVPDNKDGFAYGESTMVAQKDLTDKITQAVRALATGTARTVVVGHTLQSDQKWLARAGIHLDAAATCDIAMVDQAITGRHEKRKLEALSVKYGVKGQGWEGWHNAGNDARVTMEVMQKQMAILK